MYGLIVKLTATAGQRRELIRRMGGEDSETIPGCLSFIVAADAANDDVLWITEIWEDEASHERSLKRPPAAEAGFGSINDVILRYEKIATTRPVEGSSHPLHGER